MTSFPTTLQVNIDLSQILDDFQSVWSVSSISYVEKDTVRAPAGNVYICTADHVSSSLTEPGVGANWATVWGVFLTDGSASLTSQTLGSGVGFSVTSYSAGTKTTGTYTPASTNGNFQHATNGGAHTLAPPSTVCDICVEYLNNGSAGAITTSGFTKVVGSFTTTNGHKFMCNLRKTQNYSLLVIQALQ